MMFTVEWIFLSDLLALLKFAAENSGESGDGTDIPYAMSCTESLNRKFTDEGYRVKSLMVNNSDVTSEIIYNKYTIDFINNNTVVEVEFEKTAETLMSSVFVLSDSLVYSEPF